MPSRAFCADESPINSLPASLIDPFDAGAMPISVFSSVDLPAPAGARARDGLVEQEHPRRGGERHAHVDQTLAAIGQGAGFRLFDAGKAEIADGGVGLGVDDVDRQRIGERIEAARMPRLYRE